MYSYDHRIRAIELYIKLGKLVSPTFRQFGCPTKNALKVWNREYQQHQALPAHYESRMNHTGFRGGSTPERIES